MPVGKCNLKCRLEIFEKVAITKQESECSESDSETGTNKRGEQRKLGMW